jgi:hypothetical protein
MAKEDYIIPEKNILPKKEFIGLTDDEIDKIISYPWGETKNWVRAIEAKLKEKNCG